MDITFVYKDTTTFLSTLMLCDYAPYPMMKAPLLGDMGYISIDTCNDRIIRRGQNDTLCWREDSISKRFRAFYIVPRNQRKKYDNLLDSIIVKEIIR